MNHLGARLAAYVDGELPPQTRDMVEAHLAHCPECRAEVAAERRLKDGLAGLGVPDPSAKLLGNLLDIAGPGGAGAPVRPVVPVSPGLRPAVPGAPAPGPSFLARRRSMAAAGVVSVAAVTLGAALFGGEATSPRPETRELVDLSAIRNTTNGAVPTDIADVPAGALAGGLAAAGSASGLGGWTFGAPGFGLAGLGHERSHDPVDSFLDWAGVLEPDVETRVEARPFYTEFFPGGPR